MATQTDTLKFNSLRGSNISSSRPNDKASFKTSWDREYKLQNSNKKSPSESLGNTRDRFNTSNVEKSPAQDSKVKDDLRKEASPNETGGLENNQYQHGLQELRSTLNEMKQRAQKNELSYKQQSGEPADSKALSGHEKAIIKRRFNERENESANEQLDGGTNTMYSNLQRNPATSAGKRTVHLAYQQREKEIYNKLNNNFRVADDHSRPHDYDASKKDYSQFERSLTRSFGNSRDQFGASKAFVKSQEKWQDANEESDNKQGGYFNNKELMKAKYQQYEEDLLKQKQRAQQRKDAKEESGRKGLRPRQQPRAQNEERALEDYGRGKESYQTKQWDADEGERDQLEDSLENGINNNTSDGFYKALTNRERKLNEQFESLEKEKGRSNKSLTYRDPLYQQRDITREEVEEMRAVYAPGNDIDDGILAAELERIREENRRIEREIQEIHQRHDVERKLKSEKLTTDDLKRTWTQDGDLLSSKQLQKTKVQRKQEVENEYKSIVKSDAIKKTMQRARKGIHKKLEMNKQENAWTNAKSNRKAYMITSDAPLRTTSKSSTKKFSAGTPEMHLRESSYLLAHGVPTTYLSNRDVNLLSSKSK